MDRYSVCKLITNQYTSGTAKRAEALRKLGAVIGQATVQ